jgi:hypothetical protein
MKINPDSAVLAQVEGHWQKLFAMLLWKLKGTEQVRVALTDIEAMAAAFAPEGPVVYTHGHFDSLDFQLVTREAADRLAAHDKTQRGTA